VRHCPAVSGSGSRSPAPLLSNAGVLLLDDPFSALDASTARLLAGELVAEAGRRTVVVVTDRSDLRAAATPGAAPDQHLTHHRTPHRGMNRAAPTRRTIGRVRGFVLV
jgi:hypothetical protein